MTATYGTIGKRTLAAFVAASLLALASACGGSGGSNDAGPSEGSASSVQPSASADGSTGESGGTVEITVWDQPTPEDPTKSLKEQLFADFDKANPNIKVTHEAMPQGTNDREVFVTAMAGGNGPDAYHMAHFPIIGDWVGQGLALDLTPYWEGYADSGQFIDSSMAAARIDGKVYGVPNDMYVTGLFWNKKLFKAAGLDPNKPPSNWDELVSMGKQLTDSAKKQYGITLLGMEWADWWFEYYVWQAGGDLTELQTDGTVKLTFTSEPAVTALQFYKDLKWKHKIVQNNVLQSYQDNMNDIYQGRAAMSNGASGSFGDFAANGLDLNDIGFAPYPVGTSGKGPGQIGGAYWILNPKSSKAKQDAAWKYVTYMVSKETKDRMLQFQSDNGIFPNLLSVRKDVDPSQFTQNVPQDLVEGVNKAASDTHLEYYLKERLTPYVVKAVQKALTDQNADPATLLQAAQDAAQKEVVDAYNASAKK
ncbi:extracellular solute-binding protein [Cohnella sp. REN36]|uniref:extracellular solute-binding protein n=1 Tax=Cohnella sp. REN36 TaxID=2887347 RepID=UPI001D13FBB6|nr:extracellular solute-binding protein [Cohnella sp. REN36]MCC3376542.1 extracellular solute-binding protein [Cohnella sp. REN36]